MFKKHLDAVRETAPLIHNITNYVTVNDVANAILAVGASPIMTAEPDEVEEIVAVCSGLNINIGTLTRATIAAMFRAAAKAQALGRPLVLDPVGAGASTLRTETALGLLSQFRFSAVRGNISEIKTLAVGRGATKGVDADVGDAITAGTLDAAVDFAKKLSARLGCVVAITGATDLVADAQKCFVIRNGRAEMGRITGTGCQLSGILTAFVCAAKTRGNDVAEAVAAAVCAMGVCGEIAWQRMLPGDGNSTYRNRIIDALFNLTGDALDAGARCELR